MSATKMSFGQTWRAQACRVLAWTSQLMARRIKSSPDSNSLPLLLSKTRKQKPFKSVQATKLSQSGGAIKQWLTPRHSSQARQVPSRRSSKVPCHLRQVMAWRHRSSHSRSKSNISMQSRFFYQISLSKRQLIRHTQKRRNRPARNLFQVLIRPSLQSLPQFATYPAMVHQKASHPSNKSRNWMRRTLKKTIHCKLVCQSGKSKPLPGRPKRGKIRFNCMMITCSSQMKKALICQNSKRINL